MKTEVKYLPIILNPENIKAEAIPILNVARHNWTDSDKIQHKVFSNGITNKMYGFYYENHKDDMILIRINGNKTEIFLDRKKEIESFQLLHKNDCAPNIYCQFINGLCYEYIPGITLTKETVREPKVFSLVANEMAKMHSIKSETKSNGSPMLFTKIEAFLDLVFSEKSPEGRKIKILFTEDALRTEFDILKEELTSLDTSIVFCHNDLLLNNIIYNEKNETIKFIDYEYAAFNYQAYDIANHFCEFAGVDDVDHSLYPDKTLQLTWIKKYLDAFCDEDVTNDKVEQLYIKVNKFALASHFFWGVWSLVQAKYSVIDFDFSGYAKERIEEYFNKKEQFLSM